MDPGVPGARSRLLAFGSQVLGSYFKLCNKNVLINFFDNEQLNHVNENKHNNLVNGDSDPVAVNIEDAERLEIDLRVKSKNNDLGKQMLLTELYVGKNYGMDFDEKSTTGEED